MASTKYSVRAVQARSSVTRSFLATAFAVSLSMLACGAYAANGVNTSNSTTDLPIGAGGSQYVDISPTGQVYFGTGTVGSSNYNAYVDSTTGGASFGGGTMWIGSAYSNIGVVTFGSTMTVPATSNSSTANAWIRGFDGSAYFGTNLMTGALAVGLGNNPSQLNGGGNNVYVSGGHFVSVGSAVVLDTPPGDGVYLRADGANGSPYANGYTDMVVASTSNGLQVNVPASLNKAVTVSGNLTVTGSGNLITTPSLSATTAIMTPILYLGSTANTGDELTSESATDLLAIQNSKCGPGYALTTSSSGTIGCTQVTTIDGSTGNLVIPSCTAGQFVTANGSSFGCAAAVQPPTCSGGMTAGGLQGSGGTTLVTSGSSGLGCASGDLTVNSGYIWMTQTGWGTKDALFIDDNQISDIGGPLRLQSASATAGYDAPAEVSGADQDVIIGPGGSLVSNLLIPYGALTMNQGNINVSNGSIYANGSGALVQSNEFIAGSNLFLNGNTLSENSSGGNLYLNTNAPTGTYVMIGNGSSLESVSIPSGLVCLNGNCVGSIPFTKQAQITGLGSYNAAIVAGETAQGVTSDVYNCKLTSSSSDTTVANDVLSPICQTVFCYGTMGVTNSGQELVSTAIAGTCWGPAGQCPSGEDMGLNVNCTYGGLASAVNFGSAQ